MKVRNWIPYGDIVSHQNVTDEALNVFSNSVSVNDLIKAIGEYHNRSIFQQVFPWNVVSITSLDVDKKWREYLQTIKWAPISDENFARLQDISTTCNNVLEKIKKPNNFTLLSFISTKTAQELWRCLNNSWVHVPNLGKEKEIELANSKIFLRENFSKYMVKWLNVTLPNDREELELFLKEHKSKDGKVLLRLPRSVSWLWIRFLLEDGKEKTSENDIYLHELCILSDQLWERQILAEKLLPEDSFESPNVVWYIDNNWNVDIFGVTEQLLENKQHQWNYFNPENEKIYSYLSSISKEIAEKIYKKLWVIGYFWLDFLIVDIRKLDDNIRYFDEDFDTFFWEKAIVLVEINFRINGWMPLSWTRNLEQLEIKDKFLSIINTEEIKKWLSSEDVFSILEKENLLVKPWSDKTQLWVIPVTILTWKLQYIIVANNIEQIREYRQKVKKLLA